jgi:putative flippase GtrA
MTAPTGRETVLRWLKFNAVGAGGIAVQLATLAALKSGLQWHYALATALAVEAAIAQNYFWHERFTWVDRGGRSSWMRFLKFNSTTGLLSIVGNVACMRIFVAGMHMHYLLANALTIATLSIVNFAVSDRFVFEAE